jgi:ABC-2 type transport system permease protein
MRAIWDIAQNDLRVIFREKGIWLNIVIVPLLLAYLIGFANGAGAGTQPTAPIVLIDVIDENGTAESARFLDAVRAANPTLRICPTDNDADDVCRLDGAPFDATLAEERLRDQVSLALVIIPADFDTALAAGVPTTLLYRSSDAAFAPTFIREAVNAAAQTVGGAAAAANIGVGIAEGAPGLTFRDEADRAAFRAGVQDEAAALWAAAPITVDYQLNAFDAQQRVAQAGGGFAQSVPGMATMYVMFAVFPLASAFILERKQWTLQRLVTMPVSRAQILGGKLLARFILGMIQYGIMFAFGAVLGVRYGGDVVALVLLMMLFVLCIAALTLALTTLLKSDAQAQGVTLFLSLVLAPLGGAWWSLEIVPAFMQVIARVTPVAWVMEGYRALIFEGGTLITVLPSLGVLAGMTALFFAFGVARFKVAG